MLRACLAAVAIASTMIIGAACRNPDERCAKCGMVVDAAPRWIAGLKSSARRQRRFCSPGCMLHFLRSPDGEGASDAWVIEYYGQKRVPANQAFFVSGSDVIGPMGKSLVPVAGLEASERFRREHRGAAVFTLDQLDHNLLRALKKSGGVPTSTTATRAAARP